ncbi:MAG: ATP-binding cassette domain-containing protein [Planctomycetes bacterium]|nr:ATP-binding cassette domain-containing protein [Planctomycetota bacterium]
MALVNVEQPAAAIEARNVSFTFEEGTQALRHMNFRAGAGEFVAMLASNGSGKTTLIRVLVKLLVPQEGAVFINGKNIREIPAAQLYQQIGLVLQNPNDQLFAATVEDDVAFGPRNLGLSEAEVKERVDEALECVGAAKLRSRAIHHLSFGEKKRVCLAGVLAMKPSILVLDEPTAGLDPAGESLMMHLLKRLNGENNITVVMATHSVDMLPLFADCIYVLNRGSLLKKGTPEEVFTDQNVVDEAGLRMPYISRLVHELRLYDGVPVNGFPLTVGEARVRLVELIPPEIIVRGLVEKDA